MQARPDQPELANALRIWEIIRQEIIEEWERNGIPPEVTQLQPTGTESR